MTPEMQLAYMAGLVDADGSIGFARNGGTGRSLFVRLFVTGTCPELAEWLKSKFGGDVHWAKRQNPKWKREFMWRLSHRKAADLIAKLEPYLIVKQRQANLVYGFYELKHAWSPDGVDFQQWCQSLMKAFNFRGTDGPDAEKIIAETAAGIPS